jgi:hypothetical protein
MIVTGRVNITRKTPNYLIFYQWSSEIEYYLSDIGIPVVTVSDSTTLGQSAYALIANKSTKGASPAGAGSSEWRLMESSEFLYIQQAYIERLQAAIVTAESIQALMITTGKLTVTEGAKVGVFDVDEGDLEAKLGDNSMLLSSELIRFLGKYSSVFIGADTYPGTAGGSIIATHRISVIRNIDDISCGNIGMYLFVAGSKAYDSNDHTGNHALFIPRGSITGVRFRTRRVRGSALVSTLDTNIIVNASNTTMQLPGDSEDGQMYFINPGGYSNVSVKSSQNMWVVPGIGARPHL